MKRVRKAVERGPVNYYEKIPPELRKKYPNPNYNYHKIAVPFRMIIVAESGGGKTNFALNLIHDMSGTFEHITVCCKSKDECLYEHLERKIDPEHLTFCEDSIPNMDDFNQYKSSLIIFDDLVNSKKLQPQITEYAIRGRKKGISMMYLTQCYYMVPKPIRNQMNYIVIKKLNSQKDLKLILKEFNFGIKLDELMRLYEEATSDAAKLNWLMIDIDHPELKFRYNYIPIELEKDEFLRRR